MGLVEHVLNIFAFDDMNQVARGSSKTRNETKRNETKRNETKRNETKRNETKRDETKRNGKGSIVHKLQSVRSIIN